MFEKFLDLHPELRNIKLKLENAQLWSKFHSLETEMIITKNGRFEYLDTNYLF